MTAEQDRLNSRESWQRWGPYISERAWGTVREDYSSNGDAWNYLPHDHARSRAYRWSADGIGAAPVTLLPTLSYRNTWAWNGDPRRPSIRVDDAGYLHTEHHTMKSYTLYSEDSAELIFTDNETNQQRLFGSPNPSPYVKDAFHE